MTKPAARLRRCDGVQGQDAEASGKRRPPPKGRHDRKNHKTMIDFNSQALSKRQMSSVRGGKETSVFECVAFMDDGTKVIRKISAEDAFKAADSLHESTGAGQVNCTKIH